MFGVSILVTVGAVGALSLVKADIIRFRLEVVSLEDERARDLAWQLTERGPFANTAISFNKARAHLRISCMQSGWIRCVCRCNQPASAR